MVFLTKRLQRGRLFPQGRQIYRRIQIGLLLTTLFIAVSLGYLRWERRIDSCMGDCVITDRYHITDTILANREVALVVRAQQDGDNGAATIEIFSEDRFTATLRGSYNYDTLMDRPVAHAYYWWYDNDYWPDLAIRLTDPLDHTIYYIGSADQEPRLRVHPHESQ